MNCTHCGKNLAPSAKFCNGCGTLQLPAPATDSALASLTCPECNAGCKPGTKFCPGCGHKFSAAPAPAEAAPTPGVPPAPVDIPSSAPAAPPEGAALPPSTPPESVPIQQPAGPSTAPSTRSYIRWAIAAVFVVLVAGLAWIALKPSTAPQTEAAASKESTPAQVQDGSHDDRAKAESLVGPANQSNPAPAASAPDIAPASPAPALVAPATAPAAVAPVIATRPAESSKPAANKPAASKPTPPAPAKPAPQKAKPSLNDLLD